MVIWSGETSVIASAQHRIELAAEPRPWHRMPIERACCTMSVDGQEIGGEAQIGDQAQLLFGHGAEPVGQALGATAGQPLPGQTFQPGLGRFIARYLVGVIVS